MSRLRMAVSKSFVTGCAPPLAAMREIGASTPWISSLASRLRIRANARRHEEAILSIWDSSAHTGSPMPGHWLTASWHLAMSSSSAKAFPSASCNDFRPVNWRAYGPSTFSLRPFQKPHAFSHSMRTCSASARFEKCSTVEHGRPPIFTVLITCNRSFTGLGRNNPQPSFPPFSMCSFSLWASSCNDLISIVSGNSIRVSSAIATSSSIDAITWRVTRRSSFQREELPPRTSRKASFIHECGAARSLLRVSRKDEKALRIVSMTGDLLRANRSANRSSAPRAALCSSSIALASFLTRLAKRSGDDNSSGQARPSSRRFSGVNWRKTTSTLRKLLAEICHVLSKGMESVNHS